jgi:YhcG PDDEXK nuclease domain
MASEVLDRTPQPPLAESSDRKFYGFRTEIRRRNRERSISGRYPIKSERCGRIKVIDAGQMHLYLNYAREHWSQPEENPPVGIILCAGNGGALVRDATDNLPNKVLVREYLTALPDEKRLATELITIREKLERRQ